MTDHYNKSDADQLDFRGVGGCLIVRVLTGDEKKRALDIVAELKNPQTKKSHDH